MTADFFPSAGDSIKSSLIPPLLLLFVRLLRSFAAINCRFKDGWCRDGADHKGLAAPAKLSFRERGQHTV